MPNNEVLTINGKTLNLSNLGKVLYPQAGLTKKDVLKYYIEIAPYLLPHLKNRPLTLKRYPNGIEGKFFYQKQCPVHRPSWLETVPVFSQHNNKNIHYCVINDLASLIYVANLASLELHTQLHRSNKTASPDCIVLDLDPGPPANIITCTQVALILHKMLSSLKLLSLPKTSGSKGLQVYVPIANTSYEKTKSLALRIAQAIEKAHPDLVVSKMSKKIRTGKVLIDYSQNDPHKTTISVYSLRATPQATVSTPLHWDEVYAAHNSNRENCLSFNTSAVIKRCQEQGDLFAPVLSTIQCL